MHITESSSFFKKSIKDYLRKNIPDVKIFFGTEKTKGLEEWLTVKIGSTNKEAIATTLITIFCCTRNDDESFKLSRLADKVTPLFSKESKIPFLYEEEDTQGNKTWKEFMKIKVNTVVVGPELEGESSTKLKVISTNLKYQMKE